MRRLVPAFGITLLVWLGGPVWAQTEPIPPMPVAADADPVARAEALAAKARRLYTEEKYADAVAAYREAYDIAPTGALLYNIAYIYDHKLDLPDVAIPYYRRCLESPDVDPELMRRATERLGTLRAEQETRRRSPELPPATETTTTLDESTEAAAGTDPQWTWGWVAVGTGTATFIGGLTLDLLARNRQKDFEDSRDLATKRDLRDEGQTMALAGDIMMGVGIAGAAVGTVLLLTADRTPDTEGHVATEEQALQFGVGPTDGGALLTVGGAL